LEDVQNLYSNPYQMLSSSQRVAMYFAAMQPASGSGIGGIINNPIPM
jgi:hypothetical protein